VSLRCFIHKKNNVEEHLKGCSSAVKKEIVRDVFGSQEGEILSTGLVDCDSEQAFDVSLRCVFTRGGKGFLLAFTSGLSPLRREDEKKTLSLSIATQSHYSLL